MMKNKVLVAGATGYLGQFLTQELIDRAYDTSVVVRNPNKLKIKSPNLKVIEAELTKANTLTDVCEGIDVVISCVGLTRQKDGLTYMEVDYQANVNLLDEAKKSAVKKFIYISVLNGDKLRGLEICKAKEGFGDYLKASGLDYCIVRPNGFFSDMAEFLKMAKGGRIYLFGDGRFKLNPIHGKDLAKVVADVITEDKKALDVGGSDLLSQNEIAELALKACKKDLRIVHFPDWIRRFLLWILRTFTSPKTYGSIEFFMTTMAMDMIAPRFGKEHLADFFEQEAKK